MNNKTCTWCGNIIFMHIGETKNGHCYCANCDEPHYFADEDETLVINIPIQPQEGNYVQL